MRIATWNVNSIRSRIDRVEAWLQRSDCDVLALQETKATEAQFPLERLTRASPTGELGGAPFEERGDTLTVVVALEALGDGRGVSLHVLVHGRREALVDQRLDPPLAER